NDFFAPGRNVVIDGSDSNDGAFAIASVSGSILTLAPDNDLLREANAPGVDATLEDSATITRALPWQVDGFTVGQVLNIEAADPNVPGADENEGSYIIVGINGNVATIALTEDASVKTGTKPAQNVTGSDTITRTDGTEWANDGFAVGQIIAINGSDANDGVYEIAAIDGDVLILEEGGVLEEGSVPNVSVTSNDTITRASGSWLDDGFLPGMEIEVAGTVRNNGSFTIDSVTTDIVTLRANPVVDNLATNTDETSPDETLATERGVRGVTITGPDTITRSEGSWLADGFRSGKTITIDWSVRNNNTFTVGVEDRMSWRDREATGTTFAESGATLALDGTVLVLSPSDRLRDEVIEAVRIGDGSASAGGRVDARDVIIEAMSGDQVISFSLPGSKSSGNKDQGKTGDSATDSKGSESGKFGFGASGDVSINNVDAYVRAYVEGTVNIVATGDTHLFAASEGTQQVTGMPVLTFTDAGLNDTISRSDGSWIGDGFRAGHTIYVEGTPDNINDGYYQILSLTDSVVTLTADAGLSTTTQSTDESQVKAGPAFTGNPGLELTFEKKLNLQDTIVRSAGSWTADGFRPGQIIRVTGTSDNNSQFKISGVTASTLTLSVLTVFDGGSDSDATALPGDVLANETIGNSQAVTILAVDDGKATNILAGSGSVTLQGNDSSAGLAGSFAQNTITGDVSSYIRSAVLDVAGDVNVSARTPGEIESYAASGTKAGKLAIAGQVTINEMSRDTQAYVVAARILNADDVRVTAVDATLIRTVSGAITFGATVGVGASVAFDTIDNSVFAYVRDSDIDASGRLVVEAKTMGEIRTITAAASIANTPGLQAAGSVSINTITNETEAWIKGQETSGIRANTVTVAAADSSAITADAGGVALALARKKESGATGAATLGVSVSLNEVTNSTRAFIEDVNVLANAGVDVTANVKGGAGQQYDFTNSDVDANQDTIFLEDHGLVTGELVFYFNLSIAAAIAGLEDKKRYYVIRVDDDRIRLSRRKYSDDDQDIESIALSGAAAGAVHQIERVEPTIDALAVAGSGAGATGQGLTGAFAGAGAGAVNEVNNTVQAFILNSTGTKSVVATAGDVRVAANDAAGIQADVIGASLAVSSSSKGSSGAIAIGLSIAKNEISNDVLAYIDGSRVDARQGSIIVAATEAATIWANSVAAAVSVAVGSKGGALALSGGGATAKNTILGTSNAYVTGSNLTSGANTELNALNTALVDALVVGVAASAAVGKVAPAAAVGVALATNQIGWNTDGDRTPTQVRATIVSSTVDAMGDLLLTSRSDASIQSAVGSGALAVSAGRTAGIAAAGAGSRATNRIATQVESAIRDSSLIEAARIDIGATDESEIDAIVAAAAVAAAYGKTAGVAASIGVSLAFTHVSNEVSALIDNTTPVLTDGGDIIIAASDKSAIDTFAVAAGLAVGVSGGIGVAVSGGGAVAQNVILTKTNAYVENSKLGQDVGPGVTENKVGNVDIDAMSQSSIDAFVGAVSASIAFGKSVGVGASIGTSVARNFIGWEPGGGDGIATTYTTDEDATVLSRGQTVRIAGEAARGGEVYQYLGDRVTDGDSKEDGNQPIDLASQNFQDPTSWKQLGLTENPAQVRAYIADSTVISSGALTLDAKSSQEINALVVAGSAAVAGGSTAGVAVSGAGVFAQNKISTDVKAFVLGDGAEGIRVDSASLNANDGSSVSTVAGAASLSAGIGSTAGVSVSIGLSIALNEISNDVAAYIEDVDQGLTTTSGDVTIRAISEGQPLFDLTEQELRAEGLSLADFDDAAESDQDDPDDPNADDDEEDPRDDADNEAIDDLRNDYDIFRRIRRAFSPRVTLAEKDVIATDAEFTTRVISQDLRFGDTVETAGDFTGDGDTDNVYEYRGGNRDGVNLGVEDFTSAPWFEVELDEETTPTYVTPPEVTQDLREGTTVKVITGPHFTGQGSNGAVYRYSAYWRHRKI
ncbi:MAG: beta strand repeat-containing protein, partial [Pirellulales bacterium]